MKQLKILKFALMILQKNLKNNNKFKFLILYFFTENFQF